MNEENNVYGFSGENSNNENVNSEKVTNENVNAGTENAGAEAGASYTAPEAGQSAPKQETGSFGAGYTAQNGNYGYQYTPQPQPRYNAAGGPNGEYYYSYAPQAPKPVKKKSHKGLIAILIVAALVVGVGGGIFAGMRLVGPGSATNTDPKETVKIVDEKDGEKESDTSSSDKGKSVIIRNATDSDKLLNGVTEVVEKCADSVVEITTEKVVTSSFFGQYITSGAGSGVIITEDGYIVTCAHVVEGAKNISVKLTDGNEYKATLVGSDDDTDVAVIKIDKTGLTSAVVGDSDKLVVGADVVAIGNPLGSLGGTVTTGIISALNRSIKVEGKTYNLLQTNAAINPGNSGGGLFNSYGELIGVVNAKESATGIEGLAFAIPINDAINVAQDLINNGYVTGRPMLGIYTVSISSSSDLFQLRASQNAAIIDYIDAVGVYFAGYASDNEPEGDDKLVYGDRIVSINGTEVKTRDDISAVISKYKVGDTVTVVVSRKDSPEAVRGNQVEVKVVLVENTEKNG